MRKNSVNSIELRYIQISRSKCKLSSTTSKTFIANDLLSAQFGNLIKIYLLFFLCAQIRFHRYVPFQLSRSSKIETIKLIAFQKKKKKSEHFM